MGRLFNFFLILPSPPSASPKRLMVIVVFANFKQPSDNGHTSAHLVRLCAQTATEGSRSILVET